MRRFLTAQLIKKEREKKIRRVVERTTHPGFRTILGHINLCKIELPYLPFVWQILRPQNFSSGGLNVRVNSIY